MDEGRSLSTFWGSISKNHEEKNFGQKFLRQNIGKIWIWRVNKWFFLVGRKKKLKGKHRKKWLFAEKKIGQKNENFSKEKIREKSGPIFCWALWRGQKKLKKILVENFSKAKHREKLSFFHLIFFFWKSKILGKNGKRPIFGFFALFEKFLKIPKISTFWPPKISLFLKIWILPKWI